MRADLTKVRQALFNLLSNACKFTERGTVSLAVAREVVDGRDSMVFAVERHRHRHDRRSSSRGCSRRSRRPTRPPRASTAAPASAWR